MNGFQLVNSRAAKGLSVLTSILSGFRAIAAGRTKQGLLLLGAGMLSLQWSGVGFAAQLVVEAFTRR